MSLGSEINDWADIQHKSPYYFMRRTIGHHTTTLPTVWMVGGFFSITGGTGYKGIYQNIQTVKDGPAIWIPYAFDEVSIAALALILADWEEC